MVILSVLFTLIMQNPYVSNLVTNTHIWTGPENTPSLRFFESLMHIYYYIYMLVTCLVFVCVCVFFLVFFCFVFLPCLIKIFTFCFRVQCWWSFTQKFKHLLLYNIKIVSKSHVHKLSLFSHKFYTIFYFILKMSFLEHSDQYKSIIQSLYLWNRIVLFFRHLCSLLALGVLQDFFYFIRRSRMYYACWNLKANPQLHYNKKIKIN